MEISTLLSLVGEPFVVGKTQIQDATWQGLGIRLTRSAENDREEYRPSEVRSDQDLVWKFKREHANFVGMGRLVELDKELFIALAYWKKGDHHLSMVLPVKDLPHMQPLDNGEFVGGREFNELVSAKYRISRLLRAEPDWTDAEKQLVAIWEKEEQARIEKIRAERKAEAEAEAKAAAEKREADRAERQAAVEARRKSILGRKELHVVTKESPARPRKGVPVVDEEWKKYLKGDTWCVSVESYDPETGKCGAVIESFVVSYNKSQEKVRAAVKEVSLKSPVVEKRTVGDYKTDLFNLNGTYVRGIIVGDRQDVDHLRSRKVNSGQHVMVRKD